MLKGKKILIGITGAIAAYKTCSLIRLFKKHGAEVKVIVTENALNFAAKTSLETLSRNPLNYKQFEIDDYKPEHISLADWADIFVTAPVTANTIGKFAAGICDNLLTSVLCAFKKPIVLAPCMNTGMWENPAVQKNIEVLKQRGVIIIEPETGFLACGTEGKGRMADINIIFETVKNILIPKSPLKGKKIVITAGGTKEDIDAVRFIGNYSSGRTGATLADAVHNLGGGAVLITAAEVQNKPYKVINVKTADEMFSAVKQEFESADSLIMAAAVSDYRVKNKQAHKIKKTGAPLILELIENPDILKEMCAVKRPNQTVIGFSAESENLIENAEEKIKKKGCDYICANDISRKDTGFSSEYNELYVIDKNLNRVKIDKTDKYSAALKILDIIYGRNS